MTRIIILGGTTAAIELALSLKNAGNPVMIVTPLTYLGEDITSTWKYYGLDRQQKILPVLNRLLAGNQGPDADRRQTSVNQLLPGQIKRELLKLLNANQIETLFMTFFAGLQLQRNQVTGVLLASKSGILRLEADRVIDATLFASAQHSLAGCPVIIPQGQRMAYHLEYFGIDRLDADLDHDQSHFHRGPVRPDQAYLEITRSSPRQMTLNEAQGYMRAEIAAAARHLKSQHPQLDQAYLAGALPAMIDCAIDNIPEISLSGWLRCAADADIGKLSQSVQAMASENSQAAGPTDYLVYGCRIPASRCRVEPFDDPRLHGCFDRVSLPWLEMNLPVRQTDVAVVGGGTAGLCAARTLLDAGKSVQVIEFFSNLGGTRTIGGVNAFYLGNRNARFEAIIGDIRRFSATLNAAEKKNQTLAAEMLFYNDYFWQRTAPADLSTVVCAVIMKETTLTHFLGIGDNGITLYCPKLCLDATGDADLVFLAGEETDYGDQTDAWVQDYSQWYRHSGSPLDPPMSCNLDQDVIDSRFLSEWQRAIRYNVGHAPDYDLVEMLTVRESRRIRGKTNVTLQDIVRGTRYPDIIYEARSDYDPHSRCFRFEGRLGLLPQHAPEKYVGIPLRSMIPADMDNVLVVAKGIALDQDAFNYVRMNADMMTLGSIGGMIAAQALDQGCLPDQADLSGLRQQLRKLEAIGHLDSSRANDVRSIADRIIRGDETAFADAVLADWPDTAAVLNQALQHREAQDPILAAKTRLWFGDRSGCGLLIDRLRALNRENPHLVYQDRNPAHPGNIKGGILGALDDYWQMNQLAVLLARARETGAAEVIREMIDDTLTGGDCRNQENPYIMGRIDNQCIPNYDRVLCLAEAAKAMPRPLFGPALERLLTDPAIAGFCRRPGQADAINFHMAFLELKLAEAAAICGSRPGLQRLEAYQDDVHYSLAQYARKAYAACRG